MITRFSNIIITGIFSIICFLFVASEVNSQNEVFEIARHGCIEDLKPILKDSPEVINYKNASGFTPLILASYHGNIEIATLLAKHVENIDINSDSGTALMAAVFKKDIVITKMLLDLGADANIPDPNGTTALHYATRFSNKETIKLLVAYGADLNLKDSKGFSALDYALRDKDESILKLLKN
jgi:ankyrin repeat protein